jgi:TPR repeat protein
MASRTAQRLIKAARQGDPAAQRALGQLYLKGGEGLAPNASAALAWLLRAWKGGCDDAATAIAINVPPPHRFRWHIQGLRCRLSRRGGE